MVVNLSKRFVLFILTIFLVNCISASFETGNLSYSIEKNYAPEESIKGWINISLTDEPVTSVFKSTFGDIGLMDLISKTSNSLFDYACIPLSCGSSYSATKEETSKTFSLGENESVFIGLNLSRKSGLLSRIDSFTLNLASNNPETAKFPLAVDILNDNQYEWGAYTSSGNYGFENQGCFIGIPGLEKANIVNVQYCEKITLNKAPEVEIGAYLEEIPGSGSVEFRVSITKIDDSTVSGNCDATATGSIRIACTPPEFHITEPGNYHVCIKTLNSGDGDKYKITYEQDSPCGFSGTYANIYDYDFDIFARPKYYASNINANLNDDGLIASNGPVQDVEGYMKDYVTEMYNNNCSKDCIIPIKIFSGVEQEITLSSMSLSYIIGISTTSDKIYNVSESSAKISSNEFQKLYLTDSGIKVPADPGNYSFSLDLNSDEILSEKITVGKVAVIKSLTPTKTAVKYPTKFSVVFNDTQNISQYVWGFGDGSSETTTVNGVTHTYDTKGNYTFTITLRDSNGINSSKEFKIIVGSASIVVPELLASAEANLAYIKSQIATFSGFEQKALNYSLNLNELSVNITRLKSTISGSSSEAQYEAALGQLLAINIPKAVAKTAYSEGIAFYPQGENVNLNIIKEIGGGDYEAGKQNQYKEAVLAWEGANANMVMKYSEISSVYEDYEEPFLKVFDISITNNGVPAYLIIKDMKNLLFKEDYSEKEKEGYTYINLESGENSVVFSTTDDVDFVNLPAFVSPAISELTLAEWTPLTPEGTLKRWILFIVIVAFILLGSLAIWIILQYWYKRKYEGYLFKNRNNLYNLITYVENEKQKGTSDRDMAEKLKKAGWNSEQVRYALRKYAGKRTGMPEIPVGFIQIRKFLKGKKQTNNSEKK